MKNVDTKNLKQSKTSKGFYTIVKVLVEISLIPLMIIAVFCVISMYTSQREKTYPTVFGFSAVRILSGSMENSGFEINDVAIVQKVNPKSLKVGDVIGFYAYTGANKIKDKAEIENLPVYTAPEDVSSAVPIDLDFLLGKHSATQQRAGRMYSRIFFHQIVDIRQAEDGTLYFRTWGTSNVVSSPNGDIPVYDGFWTQEDMVVGKYVKTPAFADSALNFLGSNIAIIVLVLAPLTVLMFMLIIQLVNDLDRLKMENLIMQGKKSLFDADAVRAGIGFDMSNQNKATLIMRATAEEKHQYVKYLWRNGEIPKGLTKYLLKQSWSTREYDKFKRTQEDLKRAYHKTGNTFYVEEYRRITDEFYNRSFTKVEKAEDRADVELVRFETKVKYQ